MDQPWLVLGNFNVIRRDSERVGGNPRPLISMLEFSNYIDHCGLLETSSSGQNMSWCNGHRGVSRSWEKLDRVLMNNVFANLFPSVHFNYLSRKSSDHCPMVVFSDRLATSYGPSQFCFLNMWCLHDGFLMVNVNIRALEERLDFLENQLQSGFSKELEDDFVATKTEIKIWEKREASRLGQIAKKKWLIEGDQNSKFFHSVINQRRTKGHINKMVLVDGRVLNSTEEVHEEVGFFVISFLTFLQWNIAICRGLLRRKFQMKKIAGYARHVKQAVFSTPKSNSSGPDGFGFDFYMSCWDIIKEDVVEAARDFFGGVPLSRFYSSSFIVLIMKVPEPSSFKEFRPISLCSVAYKIFSKIIVNRPDSNLDSLVSHE
ncbi:hypothetical protein F2P56_004006 [Juglans regia]|uniref:Uncharacterized protein n=1 Tax=Juglans regia TaxID=51240 RepID=A0A833Y7E1_JUGRE|nr:hypothetical protein F2P56_004006 [Juglans regia]